MKPFDLARAEVRAVCKQDIDDVEVIVLLILALLEDTWVEQMVDAKDEIVSFLESFVDNKPTTELDVFSSLDPKNEVGRVELTARLKDHILSLIRRRADAAMDLASERVVQDAGEALLLAGALAAGSSLDFAATAVDALLRPAAVEDLRTLLRGHSTIREDKIRDLIDEYLKTPVIRQPLTTAPGSPLTALSTQTAPSIKQLWNDRLERAIGVETAAWLPQTIDLWAYRWFTVGSYRSLRQRGEMAIFAQATIDHKTTVFCRWVDGRQIDVAFADKQVENHLAAVMDGDVDRMIENWPLVSPGVEGEPDMRIGLPPYHIRCRTIPRLGVIM